MKKLSWGYIGCIPMSRLLHSFPYIILLLFLSNPLLAFNDDPANDNEPYGLEVICPENIEVECDDNYYGYLPKPYVSTDCHICKGGYIPGFIYMGMHNGNMYYCSRDKMTWLDAKDFCESKGGYLAVVGSEQENKFLTDLLLTDAAYIGLSDHEEEGNWKWVNGDRMTYSNWYYKQPNNYGGKQHYVELLKSGYWNDQYSHKKREFIMEIPCYTISKISDKITYYDTYKSRDIAYHVKDACGNVEICSYSITYKNSTKFWCPGDIEVYTSSGSAYVAWPQPVFETCCSKCTDYNDIHGYIYMGWWKGSHYYCSKDRRTWPEAKKICEYYGGHLAIPDTKEENAYIASKLLTDFAYIGISDHETEGEWRTVKGDECEWTNWYPGEPDNSLGKQHYVEMIKGGLWNDQYKSKPREYVMELPGCKHVTQVAGLPSGSKFPVGKTEITYKAYDACGYEDYCSFYVTVIPEHHDPEYCESWGKYQSYGFINKVKVSSQWFYSGNNYGYKFHDNYCVNIYQGRYLHFSAYPGYYHHYKKAYWKIYLDRNQDGDFEDAYEYIGKASGYGGIHGKIPITSHVKTGKTVLRVVMKLGSYPTGPCDSYSYGETEDFCIYVRSHKSALDKSLEDVEANPVTLHVEEMILEGELTGILVHPNPASDYLYISLPAGGGDLVSAEMFNAKGQRVYNRQFSQEELEIDVADMPSGIYIVKVMDEIGEQYLTKVMIE